MTRKHFVAIATELSEIRRSMESREALDAVDRSAAAIADVCAETNPRFDRARFLRACGVTG